MHIYNKTSSMNEEITEVLRRKLSAPRLKHTFGVADCARRLAMRFGGDAEAAYTAGLLHDIVKEESLEAMQTLCGGLRLDADMWESRALLHGPAGAEFAKKHFGVSDAIYKACFYHTVGRADMSLLEKIIYLADGIEENRTQPGVEQLRALAEQNLDKAVLQAMENTIGYLEQNGKKVHQNSLLARNYLLKSV